MKQIVNPMLIVFRQEEGNDKYMISIHPPPDYNHAHYGLLICDIVRHVANAFKVAEDDVWEWVDKEHHHQTSPIEELKGLGDRSH